jgi:hypothetical protein
MEKTTDLPQVTDNFYHIMPERDSNINGDRHWLHIQLPCDYVSHNDSFGEDEKFKMTTSYGQSLHCSFMGNSLSSRGEALKRMNSIKIWQRCYLSDHAQMMQLEISDNFP